MNVDGWYYVASMVTSTVPGGIIIQMTGYRPTTLFLAMLYMLVVVTSIPNAMSPDTIIEFWMSDAHVVKQWGMEVMP